MKPEMEELDIKPNKACWIFVDGGRDSGKGALFAAHKSMKIKCAALRKKGQIIATGLSHESASLAAGGVTGEQGFLTTSGEFLSRAEAGEVALASRQASEISSPEFGLSSSDLDRNYPPEE